MPNHSFERTASQPLNSNVRPHRCDRSASYTPMARSGQAAMCGGVGGTRTALSLALKCRALAQASACLHCSSVHVAITLNITNLSPPSSIRSWVAWSSRCQFFTSLSFLSARRPNPALERTPPGYRARRSALRSASKLPLSNNLPIRRQTQLPTCGHDAVTQPHQAGRRQVSTHAAQRIVAQVNLGCA